MHCIKNFARALLLLFLLPKITESAEIRVLTYNVWDVGFASGDYTPQRHEKICEKLRAAAADREHGWDVVLIQELWPLSRLRQYSNCGYPYEVEAESTFQSLSHVGGVLLKVAKGDGVDTGLRILSRFPLVRPRRHTYSVNGSLSGLLSDGDILANKSSLLTILVHPEAGPVMIANTHLVSRNPDDSYNGQRRRQLHELSAHIERFNKRGWPVILGGDLNFGPDMSASPDPIYTDVEAWNSLVPTLFPNLQHAAPTEPTDCTFCGGGENPFIPGEPPQNIDHIFVSKTARVTHAGVTMKNSEILFVPDSEVKPEHAAHVIGQDNGRTALHLPLSDHYGFEAALELPRSAFPAEILAELTRQTKNCADTHWESLDCRRLEFSFYSRPKAADPANRSQTPRWPSSARSAFQGLRR